MSGLKPDGYHVRGRPDDGQHGWQVKRKRSQSKGRTQQNPPKTKREYSPVEQYDSTKVVEVEKFSYKRSAKTSPYYHLDKQLTAKERTMVERHYR